MLVVLIKKRDRKCRLTLPEEKIIIKNIHSFKNNFTQFPRKMRALRIFHLTISLLTLLRNTKRLQYAKNLQN